MNRPTTILFDLDDTLLDTTPAYFRKIDALVERLAPEFPEVARERIRAIQEEIDIALVEAHGFGRERFPASFVETYRTLARQAGTPFRAEIEKGCLQLAATVFEVPPALVDGAAELLSDLEGRCELLLYTMGVQDIQRWKIDHHQLAPKFDEIHIVEEKSVDRLRSVIGARVPGEVMVVGDSLRCEIAPAVTLGCRAVWVKRKIAWRFHDAEVRGPYVEIETLADLRKHLALPV